MNDVEIWLLDYGPTGVSRVPFHCPTCQRDLREVDGKGKVKVLLECPHCGLQMEHLRVFYIPDEHGEPWVELIYWVKDGRTALTWRPCKTIKLDEYDFVRQQIVRPLFEAHSRRLVAEGKLTTEEGQAWNEALLNGGNFHQEPPAPTEASE